MTQKNVSKWTIMSRLTPQTLDNRTVMEARGQAEKMLRAGAAFVDPVTGRTAQVYDRGITPKMVEVLALIYHHTRNDRSRFVSAQELKTRGGDYGKLRHWGLIEQKTEKGAVPGEVIRKPMWRITEKGLRFVEDDITIPKKILVFNDRRVGFVDDKLVSFSDIMGGLDLKTVLSRKGVS